MVNDEVKRWPISELVEKRERERERERGKKKGHCKDFRQLRLQCIMAPFVERDTEPEREREREREEAQLSERKTEKRERELVMWRYVV